VKKEEKKAMTVRFRRESLPPILTKKREETRRENRSEKELRKRGKSIGIY